MNDKLIYILIYLIGVIISSVSQILLKKSAQKVYRNKIKEYMNWYVIISYGVFFAATIVTIIAYKEVPLSMGPILGATGYIFVAVLSWLFLKEKITFKKAIGLSVIVIGIIIYSL